MKRAFMDCICCNFIASDDYTHVGCVLNSNGNIKYMYGKHN